MKARRTAKKRTIFQYLSRSPEDTQKFGFELARALPVPGIVLLRGSLGMGKTTLTRGIAQGLGLKDVTAVNSPSFTLVNVYHGICPIYHVDLYRLAGARDLYSIGLDDFLGQEGVSVIEWSERLPETFPDATIIGIEDAGGDQRILHVSSPGTGKRRRKPAL